MSTQIADNIKARVARKVAHTSIAHGLTDSTAQKRLAFYNEVVLPMWSVTKTMPVFTRLLAEEKPKQHSKLTSIVGRSGLTPLYIAKALFPTPSCVCGASVNLPNLFCSEGCSRIFYRSKSYPVEVQVRFGEEALIVGEYVDHRTRIAHKCKKCDKLFQVSPQAFLKRNSPYCPKCCKLDQSADNCVTKDVFTKRLKSTHGSNISLIGGYSGMKASAKFYCHTHNVPFYHPARTALMRFPCPECLYERQAANALTRVRTRNLRYKTKTVTIKGRTIQCQGYEPQAIEWILGNVKGVGIKDFCFDNEGGVPTVRYKLGRRMRTYFPDMFIAKKNLVVEVKSTYTLGLTTGKGWRKNQVKAQTVMAEGYKFIVLLMDGKGTRIGRLPKGWESMRRQEVLTRMAMSQADVISPELGVKKFVPSR